jgi:hypothetical protein
MTSTSRAVRIVAVAIAALALLVAALTLPPTAQPAAYHAFADHREVLGIVNFWNVATNLPFLIVGALGIWRVRRGAHTRLAFLDPAERRAYSAFFGAVTLTAFGSAFYHLEPADSRLVWDRLPMTMAFMSLASALVTERIDARVGARLLLPLLAAGLASVAYWRWSAAGGTENLTPYAVVQYGTIAVVLMIAALFPSRYDRRHDLYGAFLLYALAKLAEGADTHLFMFGRWLSGHSLKHLLAAAAVYTILRGLSLRSRVEPPWAGGVGGGPQPAAERLRAVQPRKHPADSVVRIAMRLAGCPLICRAMVSAPAFASGGADAGVAGQ